MRQRYLWSTLGENGALRAVAFGSYDQVRRRPQAWSQDGDGLMKRVGASYGKSVVSDATKYSVSRVLHQDPAFVRCTCSSVARRLWHGMAGPFEARNESGATVLSPATLAGVVAGQLVAAAAWYPGPNGAGDIGRRVGMSLLLKVGMDLFREFRPVRGAVREASRAPDPSPALEAR